MNYLDYFNIDQIISLLCKYRAAQARRRHKIHFLRNISLSETTNTINEDKYSIPKELSKILPSRRSWITLNKGQREIFKNSYIRNQKSILKTIKILRYKIENDINIKIPDWYNNLDEFVQDIKNTLNNSDYYRIKEPEIRGEPKWDKKNIYRPISVFNCLKDRVIISLTARYFNEIFDFKFHDCSFAFRIRKDGKIKTHHDTIDEILNFQKRLINNKIWVSECDIQKFFDSINHEVIKNIFFRNIYEIEENGKTVDRKAIKVFESYLDSYAFNININRINNSKWFELNCSNPFGRFESIERELKKTYYSRIKKYKIGIPQGGAISCFIANLILNEADNKISNIVSENINDLKYIRYCDDMIILSKERELCKKVLSEYIKIVKKLKLLVHKPVKPRYYKKVYFLFGKRKPIFWSIKSKKPYQWGEKNGRKIPWISFVGYQIRYDGLIRIRKSSIEKEKIKLENEANKILKALNARNKKSIENMARISKKQIVHRLLQRYISMAVGRIRLHEDYKNTQPELCWALGFKKINDNYLIEAQLKNLDRFRDLQIRRIKQRLYRIKKPPKKEFRGNKKFYYDYYGAPFSYYGILNKTLN